VRGVRAALRWRKATCLERCLVLQAWLAAHGELHDVVVGVSAHAGFSAHAWVEDYDAEGEGDGYEALTRIGPPA
jgi:hypothetical protein